MKKELFKIIDEILKIRGIQIADKTRIQVCYELNKNYNAAKQEEIEKTIELAKTMLKELQTKEINTNNKLEEKLNNKLAIIENGILTVRDVNGKIFQGFWNKKYYSNNRIFVNSEEIYITEETKTEIETALNLTKEETKKRIFSNIENEFDKLDDTQKVELLKILNNKLTN